MPSLSAKKAALMSEAVRQATTRRVLGTEEDYQKGGRFHEHGLGHVKVELSPVHENVMIQKSFGSFPEFCKTVCARTTQQTADLRARRRLTLTRCVLGPVCAGAGTPHSDTVPFDTCLAHFPGRNQGSCGSCYVRRSEESCSNRGLAAAASFAPPSAAHSHSAPHLRHSPSP